MNEAWETRTTSDGRTIVTLPTRRERLRSQAAPERKKLRVAAYARVSTDHEEQQNSYEAQVDYYTRAIKARTEWAFAGMYADEGISATSTAKREGFRRMIADAMAGKIDRILTKSVSRFARNTVDSISTIRMLKEKGIGITFEKENIDTLDSKGELLITLMSSLAQEESRSISENTTWGQRKRFADGKVTMSYKRFLGYDRGENGEPVINEEQARVVRLIYRMYLDGRSEAYIARQLMQRGILSPGGKETWATTTIRSILTNEKYKGDALLQKTFCTDFLTKKTKVNEGELPQYYVKNSHPAIVSEETFELAQSERRRRKESKTRISSGSAFAGKLYCGECGNVYGRKVWNSNNKYRSIIWRCNRKYDKRRGATYCTTQHLTAEQIQNAFLKMMGKLMAERTEVLAFYEELLPQLSDTADLENRKAALEREGEAALAALRTLIRENAGSALEQEAYHREHDTLSKQLDAIRERMGEADREILLRRQRRVQTEQVMSSLRAGAWRGDFDEEMFGALVDRVTVYSDRLVFRLKEGTERTVTR